MLKCQNTENPRLKRMRNRELYYWPSRCNNGWAECPDKDDQDLTNPLCKTRKYT